MKVCSKCSIQKPLSEFYKQSSCKLGVQPSCKECQRAEHRHVYEMRKKFGSDYTITKAKELPEGMSKCANCTELKPLNDFYKDKGRKRGVISYCKVCANEKLRKRRLDSGVEGLEVRRKWSEENRERLREQDRMYKDSNRVRLRVNENKRRARKASLPDTLTNKDTDSILTHFDNKCALCDSPAEALDHFIPLATGRGGTTKENIIPLCSAMNSSKHAKNPFEWSERYLTKEQQLKFKALIKYLSDINGLTVNEYREFVFSCFENNQKITGKHRRNYK